MRGKRYLLLLLAVCVGLLAVLLVCPRGVVHTQSPATVPIADDSVVSFRVRFGVNDTEPRTWDGTLSATGGEVLNLRNWRPRPEDRIEGKTGWNLATRKGPNYRWRPWQPEPLTVRLR